MPRGIMGPLAEASQAKAAAAQRSAEAAYQAQLPEYEQTLANDINTGNYGGAWQFATTHGDNANISQAQQSANNAANIYAKSYDPLTAMLETSAGLKSLDPNKQWSQQDVTNFYSAANPYWHQDAQVSNGQIANSGLGENPYRESTTKGTEWGTNANLTQDAATNYQTAPGSAPDLARFAGQSASDPNFLEKYGAPIAAIALACVAPEAIGALSPMLGGGVLGGAVAGAAVGAGGSAAIDEISGQPLTLKSVGAGAIGGAIGGSGVLSSLNSGVGNVVSDATGSDAIGNIAGDIAQGAGKGAVTGALTGNSKNIGTGALIGGVGAGIGSTIDELGNAAGANQTLTNAAGKAASTAGTNELKGKSTNGAGLAEGAALGVAGGALMGAVTGSGGPTEGSGVAGQQSGTSSNSTPVGKTMSDDSSSDDLTYIDPVTGNGISDSAYYERNGIDPFNPYETDNGNNVTPPEVTPPPSENFNITPPPGSGGGQGGSGQIPGLSSLLSSLGLGGTNLASIGGLAGLAALIGKATGQTNSTSTAFNPPPLFGSTLGNTGAPGSSGGYGGPPLTKQVSPNVNYGTYGETGHTPSQAFFQPPGGYSNNGMSAGTQIAGTSAGQTGAGAPNGLVGNGSLPPGLLQTMQALNTQGNTPVTGQPSMYGQPPMQQPGYGGGWGQQPYGPGNGLQPGAGMQTGPRLNNPGNNGGVTLPASGINSWQVQHHASGGYISNVTDDDNHYDSGGQTSNTGPGYQPMQALTGSPSLAHGISDNLQIQPLAKWQLHQGYAQGGVAGSADGQPEQSNTSQLSGQLTNGNVNGTHSQPVGGPLPGLQMLQQSMQGDHQTMSPAQPPSGLWGQAGVSGGGALGSMSPAQPPSGLQQASAASGLQQASGGMPQGVMSGGGQSPSAIMQQVQSSPYTASPNPAPSPPPLAVQSTANSAPGAQTQASTPGTTTPAIQQANPQMSVSTPQPSMPHFMQPGVTSPSARQGPMLPASRMGTQQRPNADGTNPWQMPASSWNQQHGGPHFADGGFNPSGGVVRGNPPPGVLEQIIRALSPPVRSTEGPPFTPPPERAHGGMAPQVHERGALGALAPDMTSPPDHMGNSRPNYTGNMTKSSGRADDINAKLANNEYIMDAETTALAGDGNPDEGARRFDKLREEIRKHKGKALAKGKISPNAKPRLSAYNPEMVR